MRHPVPFRRRAGAVAVLAALLAAVCVAPAAAAAPWQDGLTELRNRGDAPQQHAAPAVFPEVAPWAAQRLRTLQPGAAALQAFGELDSADFAVRERASRALLTAAVTEDELYVLLRRAGLSSEQRMRLLAAAERRILDAPRGALGIQMHDRFANEPSVTVASVIVGMPAEGVLQAGDRIIDINGIAIRNSAHFVQIVQNLRPGSTARLVVVRSEVDAHGRVKADAFGRLAEARLDLEVVVGSTDDIERLGGGMILRPTGVAAAREHLVLALRRELGQPVAALMVQRRTGETLEVERHPDIVEAHALLARARDPSFGSGVKSVMDARIAHLEAQARAPHLAAEERAWLDAVVVRYRELMRERGGVRAPERNASDASHKPGERPAEHDAPTP